MESAPFANSFQQLAERIGMQFSIAMAVPGIKSGLTPPAAQVKRQFLMEFFAKKPIIWQIWDFEYPS
jgi:hypothetical protein